MANISLKTITATYLALSKIHDDPNAQGATQVVSALRYFFALDKFYKKFHRNCDTRNSEDKNNFNRFVGDLCHICESKGVKYYTTNFYLPLKEHNGDYSVGSNFYSAGQIKVSLSNNGALLDYPQRGTYPLFNIQNGQLIHNQEYYKNLLHYLPTPESRVAIAVWLCRYKDLQIDKNDLSGKNLLEGITKALLTDYSEPLVNLLLDNQSNDNDSDKSAEILGSYPISYTPKQCVVLEPKNIEQLFPEYLSKKTGDKQSTLMLNEVDLRDDYTLVELGTFLSSMATSFTTISDFPGGIGAVCVAFGFKYGKSILNGNYTAKDLVDEANKLGANINHTQDGNINEGLHLYSLVEKGIFGLRFIKKPLPKIQSQIEDGYTQNLAAMRTKPFLLLAGISGTGKSRIVKEMAFASCPPSLRKDDVTPGNYCMIEVKPNWHDSTELIGYVSSIPEPHYVVTPFVNFLIKAMHNPKAPFFVCLDEMNLAPVEQYFAEFLSVLESRKLINDEIVSEPLIKADYTKAYIDNFVEAFTGKKQESKSAYGGTTSDPAAQYMSAVFEDIKENGLRLPPNVIVVGTVNMDETTYQFSRKVIDRAMTIEMNEVDFDSMFGDTADTLKYRDPYVGAEYFLPKYTAAKDALSALNEADRDYLKENIPATLKSLDATLVNTPFRIAYRVENELILYFAALREEQPEATADALLATAVDDILIMKVLPRIEGNEDVLTDPLSRLENFTRDNYPKAHGKVEEMQTRLEANHFTSFWP